MTDEVALRRFGLASETPIEYFKISPATLFFTEERLLRASYLIGNYNGLHICHGDNLAGQWMKLQNRNRIFGGIPLLEFMILSALDAVHQIRWLIGA
jgi:hypothetical protein